MKLDFYQSKILEINIQTNKEKYKPYFYSLLGINKSLASIEELLSFNYTNVEKLIEESLDALFFSFKLLSDFEFPITTSEFSLENYKNNLKSHQKGGSDAVEYYQKQARISLGKINNLVKENIGNGGEFDAAVKLYLLNYLYDVITKIFLLLDHYGLSIDVLLEKSLNKLTPLVSSKKEVEKLEKKVKEK